MSGSFGAQTPAIASAASAFSREADPIITQAERLQTVRGGAHSAGRDYAAQGEAYRQALTGPVEKIVRSFGERCLVVGTKLADNATGYAGSDASGAAGLSSAGGAA